MSSEKGKMSLVLSRALYKVFKVQQLNQFSLHPVNIVMTIIV